MTWRKEVLAPLDKCYAVNAFPLGGKDRFLFASEVSAPCYCFDADTLEREVVWQADGGTMAMLALPDRDAEFLAIQNFFPPFAAAESKLVWVRREADGHWQVRDYLSLPYLHRFGIMTRGGQSWLVLATLCAAKAHKDDWSSPGSVYAAPLTAAPEQTPRPVKILDGQFHNHGFFTGVLNGVHVAAIGSDQGSFLLTPPENPEGAWSVRQLTDVPTGEVWLEDLDGDGTAELVTIEAFHGSDLKVYHLDDDGRYRLVWQLPEPLEFAHALWCGTLWGQRCGVCGSRRGQAPLFRFYYENGSYHTELIESGASAANVWVGTHRGRQCLLSANHGQGVCAMYLSDSI